MQLLLRTCDSGIPTRCANTTARVSVARNQFAPQWQQLPYQIVLAEDRAPDNVALLNIRAVDSDLLVSQSRLGQRPSGESVWSWSGQWWS